MKFLSLCWEHFEDGIFTKSRSTEKGQINLLKEARTEDNGKI